MSSIKGSVKFFNAENRNFYPTLKKRVDTYFAENHLSRYGNKTLVWKTGILLGIYLLPFLVILIFQPGWALVLLLSVVMGIGVAGLGMSVMHDANHDSYSSNKKVNRIISHVLNLMGGSRQNWKLQHNILHHTYTNVTHLDNDIDSKPALRLSPHTPVKKIHKYQWLHSFLMYGLTTLYWVTAKDFIQFVKYRREKVSNNTPAQDRTTMVKMILLKVLYFSVFIGVPIFVFDLPVMQVITGFILMHFIAGVILTVIFQLAHSLEGTQHPLPNQAGVIETDWAVHQMQTTMNFSPNNKWLSWYVGGLNFQVEHHLFPRISHVHYPSLALIVKRTANEFNVPYLQHQNFGAAFRSHISFLKRLGKFPDINEAIV